MNSLSHQGCKASRDSSSITQNTTLRDDLTAEAASYIVPDKKYRNGHVGFCNDSLSCLLRVSSHVINDWVGDTGKTACDIRAAILLGS